MVGWERSVYSTMVQAIGYDPDTNELIVTWNNGKRSAYGNVSEDEAADIANAPSVGQAVNAIKHARPHRYL